MFWLTNELEGRKIHATDEELGKVSDLYFDDESWVVRYFVVDTGPWLFGRRVLVSPVSVSEPEIMDDAIPVELTKKQIEESPAVETELPVHRQHEILLADYYGWPAYWPGYHGYPLTNEVPVMKDIAFKGQENLEEPQEEIEESVSSPHLRSVDEVRGYHIHAQDRSIGHVEDFVCSPVDWTIRYIVIDTANWLPSKKVLISPSWVEKVDWGAREVFVGMQSPVIEDAPAYDPDEPITREYEQVLHTYYGRMGYWE